MNCCVRSLSTVCILAWWLPFAAPAQPDTSTVVITTVYSDGVFTTDASMEITAPVEMMHGLLRDMNRQLRGLYVDSLQWVTAGLSGKDNENNLLRIEYTGGRFDSATGRFDVFMDIYAPFMKRRFTGITVTALLESDHNICGNPFIAAKLWNANFFLKTAGGIVSIHREGNRNRFTVQSSVRFAWLFNLFITPANYSAIAEWRIRKLLENLNAEAVRRQRE